MTAVLDAPAGDAMKVLSVFSGVGGFDIACHRAGMEVVAIVEIDPAARAVLARRFPGIPIYEDVTLVHKYDASHRDCANCLPDVIINTIAGGWPCQDLSIAGRRLGLGGKRSGLWWEIVRLLGELSARWFIGENVPGLLSACCPCPGDDSCRAAGPVCPGEPHSVTGGVCPGGCMAAHGGAMGAVLGSLAELGYGVAYRVLDAQFFGVPQRRRRVFFVGCLGNWTAPAEVLLEPESGSRNLEESVTTRPGTAATLTAGLAASRGVSHPGRRAEDDVNLVLASTLQGAATLSPFDLGSDTRAVELIVQPAAVRGRDGGAELELGEPGEPYNALRAGDGGSSRQSLIVTHALTSEGADASEDGTGRGTPLVVVPLDLWNAVRGGGTGVGTPGTGVGSDGDPVGTISTNATTAVGISFNQRGEGRTRDAHGSLMAQPGAGQWDGVMVETSVRRLTPKECERLQGFPDDWTEGQADGPRYRQMGNAVAVPVVEWLLRRVARANDAIEDEALA